MADQVTSAPKPGMAAGGSGTDPTENVRELVIATERRLDDLRVEAEHLSAVKHQHSRELIGMHADHAKELREAETKRLDAIRAVDVAAASVIANQVSTSAETLRSLVSTTATTLATQAAATFNQLSDRIAQLERTSYEGSGKSAVADPVMARMVEAVEALRTNMAKGQGGVETRQEGRSNVGMILGILGAIFTFLMLGAVIIIAALRGVG